MSLGTFLSPQDAAERLGMEKRVIYKAIEAGELKAHKIGNRFRIRPDHFESWLDAHAA